LDEAAPTFPNTVRAELWKRNGTTRNARATSQRIGRMMRLSGRLYSARHANAPSAASRQCELPQGVVVLYWPPTITRS
jgi:hypothetical protein